MLQKLSIYTLVFAIMALSDAAIPILPELSKGESVVSSLIFSAYFTGALVAMLPSGILTDHYGNNRFILLAAVLTTISGLILVISDHVWFILIARFIGGLGAAAFFPAAFSILADFEKKEQCIGEFNFLLNLGLGAGVVVAGALAATNTIYGVLVFTILSIIPLAIAWKLPKENTPHHTRMVEHLFASLKNTTSMLFRSGFSSVWIVAFVLFGATGVVISVYPEYVLDRFNKSELGIYLFTLYIGAMLASLVGGHVNTRSDRMVQYGVVVTGIGTLITVVHPIGFALLGVGSGLGLLGLVNGIARLDVERGFTMGIFNTCTYGGLAVLPVIAGFGLPIVAHQGVIIITGVILLLIAVLPLKMLRG